MYKTLPSALRRSHGGSGQSSGDEQDGAAGTASEASTHPPPPRSHSRQSNRSGGNSDHGPLFGINLNLGLSNLISGGMHFLGNLRNKKTPSESSAASTPVASNSSPPSSSSSTAPIDAAAAAAVASHYESAKEYIELSSFPSLPEVDGHGEGHNFELLGTYNPTWCDLCGELIWGLYDTGATKCVFCQFTCHIKCQKKVRLNCSVLHSVSSSASSSMTEGAPVAPDMLAPLLPGKKPVGASVASSLEPNLSSRLDEFVTAAETFEDDSDEDEDPVLKNGIEVDESTLHNISTLRSELGNDKKDATLTGGVEKGSKAGAVPATQPADNPLDDDDDAYKTLRDVESFQFDLDEVPVRKSVVDETEPDATLTLTKSSAAASRMVSSSRAAVDNLTLSRQFSLVNYVALPLSHEDLLGEYVQDIVQEYNRLHTSQQETVVENDGEKAKGFIRVQLSLRRPINVISGQPVPSVYKISNSTLSESSTATAGGRQTLTSFYLPPDTIKCLHVDTDTTTRDVIRSLLAKFRVADNPHKYALYEKRTGGRSGGGDGGDEDAKQPANKRTLSRLKLRKMSELERPLVLALLWVKESKAGQRSFVLQENDPGDVSWESFSVPELKNFLRILDREEAWYKRRIHEKYEALHGYMRALAREKREADDTESSSAI